MTAETRKTEFKWADSLLGPRAHHPAWPNAESINVLGAERTQGEESGQAWAAKANSTVTPCCWNSPGTTLWRACPLARQVQAAIPPPPNLGPVLSILCCFVIQPLGFLQVCLLASLEFTPTSADEFYSQHSTPLRGLQNSSLTLRGAVLNSGGTPTMTPPINDHLPYSISFKPRPRDRSCQYHHPFSQMGEPRSVMKSYLPRPCAY